MLHPEEYYDAEPGWLKSRLITITAELCEHYQQLGDAMIAERKTYHHEFNVPEAGESVAARSRYADGSTLSNWIAVKEIETQIKDYETERDLLWKLMGV